MACAIDAGLPAAPAQADQPAMRRTLDRPGQALAQGTPAARQLIDWVKASADNQHLPFIVIDKRQALALAFDAAGQLRGTSPVLLGAARGDHSVPGIGQHLAPRAHHACGPVCG